MARLRLQHGRDRVWELTAKSSKFIVKQRGAAASPEVPFAISTFSPSD